MPTRTARDEVLDPFPNQAGSARDQYHLLVVFGHVFGVLSCSHWLFSVMLGPVNTVTVSKAGALLVSQQELSAGNAFFKLIS